MFWEDKPPEPKQAAEKVKATPPPRTWEEPGYLPNIPEVWTWQPVLFTDQELVEAATAKIRLVVDVETYPNYFLVAFKTIGGEKVAAYWANETVKLDIARLEWVMQNFTTVGFSTKHFDIPLINLALAGYSVAALKEAANFIIQGDEAGQKMQLRQFYKRYKVKPQQFDNIDIQPVAPQSSSLKSYGGRLHCKRLQDLPFEPQTVLTPEQQFVTLWYCVNDLDTTIALYDTLKEQVMLREALGREYGVDLRSKSDAQIAEAVISSQVTQLNGFRAKQPELPAGTVFRYRPAPHLKFESQMLKWLLEQICASDFVIDAKGYCNMDERLSGLELPIDGTTYRIGIGGLHSCEGSMVHVEDQYTSLHDFDVTSYYPRVILTQRLFPKHLTETFLFVYNKIVETRLAAKAAGDKVKAENLKIVVNGSFGKLASRYSALYSPDLMMQVTITGQLTLLMFIERMVLNGFKITSANTDGVVVKCMAQRDAAGNVVVDLASRQATLKAMVEQFYQETQCEMEETRYRSTHNRDVNSYIAIKPDGKTKNKGAFNNPWNDPKDAKKLYERLSKNPVNQICIDAIEALYIKGTPIEQTIGACRDITKLVTVRRVKGGAWKNGEYLGKTVRWYYATGAEGCIVSAQSGNKVARSDGAKPCMLLPDVFPDDVDYERYLAETQRLLNWLAGQQDDELSAEAASQG